MTLDQPDAAKVESLFRSYWVPLLRDGPGLPISLPKLMGELYDAYHLVTNARKVYRHVTGGMCEDLTASAEGIIAMADRQVERRLEVLQARILAQEDEIRRYQRDLSEMEARALRAEASFAALEKEATIEQRVIAEQKALRQHGP